MKFMLYSFLVLALVACSGKQAPSEPSDTGNDNNNSGRVTLTAHQLSHANIVAELPGVREMYGNIRVSGKIGVPPESDVSVSVPLGGYLLKVNVLPGTKVQKGTVLAVLEDPQYIQLQQDYLVARNRLEYLQKDYDRQKQLNATKATSDKTMEEIRSEYFSQQVLEKAMSEKLKLIGIDARNLDEKSLSRSIVLRAPISGYITSVNANVGKYVNPTDVLFQLLDPARLHLHLLVFEEDATNIEAGQKILFSVNNAPDRVYEAEVDLVTPDVNADRTVEVHGHIANNYEKLMPGMFVNADIEVKSARKTALPEDAVVQWEEKDYVFLEEKPGTYRLIPVQKGIVSDGYVAVSELPEGKIVVKNAYTLLMKMKNSEEE